MSDKDSYIIASLDRLHNRLDKMEENNNRRLLHIETHYAQKISWVVIGGIVTSFTAIISAFAYVSSLFKKI